jgi:hypothetical protein
MLWPSNSYSTSSFYENDLNSVQHNTLLSLEWGSFGEERRYFVAGKNHGNLRILLHSTSNNNDIG